MREGSDINLNGGLTAPMFQAFAVFCRYDRRRTALSACYG
jgi:hypothetical protein